MIGEVALDNNKTGKGLCLDVIDVVAFDRLQTGNRCGRVWFKDPGPEPDC
jgi:hypothetical protein